MTSWGKCYYKLGQLRFNTNWGSFILLQIGASVITNLVSFVLTQIGATVVTNWGSLYYKLGHNSWHLCLCATIAAP